MKFKIIANEQTPAVFYDISVGDLIKNDKKKLIKFLSFASRQHGCVGLASNQVSCDGQRIMNCFFAIKVNHVWDLIIDPVILEYHGEKSTKEEGCLTWIGKTIIAERYPEIVVRYFNIKGEIKNNTLTGYEAQIWQHEYSHLKGREEKFK